MGNVMTCIAVYTIIVEILNIIFEEEKDNWSNLPADLLQQVAELLKSDIGDYVRFRSVCTSWRSSTTDIRFKRDHPPQVPWLIMEYNKHRRKLLFFNLSDKKKHSITLPHQVMRGNKRLSSSHKGWLVIDDKDSLNGFMFNPITRERLDFPSSSTLPHYDEILEKIPYFYFFGNVASDSSPNSPSCTFVVCLIRIPALASFRTGDRLWTILESGGSRNFTDVIFYKGKFIAVSKENEVLVYNSKLDLVSVIGCPRPWFFGCQHWHFVESLSGNNLLMCRSIYNFTADVIQHLTTITTKACYVKRVEIFSLNMEGSIKYWTEIKDLHNEIIFLAHSGAISIPSTTFPIAEQEAIYLSRDDIKNSKGYFRLESGIYSLKNDNVKPLPWKGISGLFWHIPCYY